MIGRGVVHLCFYIEPCRVQPLGAVEYPVPRDPIGLVSMRFFKETLVRGEPAVVGVGTRASAARLILLDRRYLEDRRRSGDGVEAGGCEERSGGGEVWANDLTASDAATTSSSFPKKHRSRAICAVAMKAIFLRDMGVPPTLGSHPRAQLNAAMGTRIPDETQLGRTTEVAFAIAKQDIVRVGYIVTVYYRQIGDTISIKVRDDEVRRGTAPARERTIHG